MAQKIALDQPKALVENPEFDIIRSYNVKGSHADTYLRRGNSNWGYTKLVERGRWNETFFQGRLEATLEDWDTAEPQGRAVVFEKDLGFGGDTNLDMRVVVQYGNRNQGIITAYYI